MKKTLFTLAALLLIGLASCQKDDITPVSPDNNDTTPTVERRAAFLGTYDMTYITDSASVDGDWFENGYLGQYYDDDFGYLIISTDDTDTASVKIDGYVVYPAENGYDGDTLYFYNTRATFNAQNQLIPEDCTFEMNGYFFTIQLGQIVPTQDNGIRFRIEQHVPLMGMDCGYILTATGTKRQ